MLFSQDARAGVGDRVADRTPNVLVELGSMARLSAAAVVRGLRPPLDYGPEYVMQLRFTIGVCFVPMMLTTFALAFGPAGVQASNFLGLLGTYDRLGGVYQLAVVREFAPLVTAIILAGAAGTAICADLGARKVREEIDALAVLGIDPVKYLVLPRALAVVTAAFFFNIFAVIAGLAGAVAVLMQNHAPTGPFFANFFSNANTTELIGAQIKCVLFGLMIALVACYRGLRASGGPEGVGRAVNQSVVISFLLIGFVNYFYTQLMLATNPLLSEVRG